MLTNAKDSVNAITGSGDSNVIALPGSSDSLPLIGSCSSFVKQTI